MRRAVLALVLTGATGAAAADPAAIGLGRYRFDPAEGPPPAPRALLAPAALAVEGLYLVQFHGPIAEEWQRSLGAAAEVLDYVPENAYLVWFSSGQAPVAAARGEVRAVVPLAPALKLAGGSFGLLESSGPLRLDLGVRRSDHLAATLGRLEALGAAIDRHHPLLGQELVQVTIDGSALLALARDPEVISISPRSENQLDGEVAKRIVDGSSGAGPGVSPPGYRAFLAARGVDGSGVTVGIVDDGVDRTDPSGHFSGRVASALRGEAEGSDGHGHHVAGIVAGDCAHPPDPDGYLWGIGVAPRAGLVNVPALRRTRAYAGSERDQVRDVVTTAAPNGVTGSIASCSWGSRDTGTDYTMTERLWDSFVRDADDAAPGNQPLVISFSSGNAGPGSRTLTRPHAGKNLIVTGNSLSYRPALGASDLNLLDPTSSRGPTQDGRFKPDLVAPGTHVASALTAGFTCSRDPTAIDAAHVYCTGTSMAQPHTAGAAALFIDAWQQDHAGARPSPALVKAALVNGARDLVASAVPPPDSTGPAPNFDEGFGLVDIDRAVRPSLPAIQLDEGAAVLGATGDRSAISFALADPARPLTATLVWTDAPGAAGANPALVNDLDLGLAGDLGLAWVGNGFSAGVSDPGIVQPDRRNNVEKIYLDAPADDLYTLEVLAANLPGDGVPGNGDTTDQDYALVVTNAERPAAEGKVRLLGGTLRCGGRAEVLVYDRDIEGQGQVQVRVASAVEPGGEVVVLTETAAGSGFFRGGIGLVAGAPAPDGQLQTRGGDTVTVTYVDADDGRGGIDVVRTATEGVDCAGPAIGNVRVTALTNRSAVIAWDTDEDATSEVELVAGAVARVADAALVRVHAITVPNLEPCTRYLFQVASIDAAGNRSEDRNSGAFFALTTWGDRRVFASDFEASGGGFGHFGPLEEWEWGAPLRGPASAASGDRLWGTDLDATYAKLGRAAPNGDFLLLSPPIDLAGVALPRLRLKAWYDIATDGGTDDGAWVEVSDGTGFRFVAPDGGYGGTIDSNAPLPPGADGSAWTGYSNGWREAEFDLAAFAGRTIVVRLHLFEEDNFLAGAPGLYVDDFAVFSFGDCRRGEATIGLPAAGCGATLPLAVVDQDLNLDPDTAETVAVRVSSSTEPGGEPVTLVETGASNGRFVATIPTAAGAPAADGRLQIGSGDRIVLGYLDADDGSGRSAAVTAEVGADCTPPAIGGLSVAGITDRSAELSWRTDEPATSRVDFGSTPALGLSLDDRTLTRLHRVLLHDLDPCTSYFFRVSSADLAGTTAVEDDGGALHRFDTATGRGVLFADDFEVDRGWTIDGEWQRDVPRGLLFATTRSMDPNAALSRERVLGVDLTGLGTQPGDYEAAVPLETATSPPFDCSRASAVTLEFGRWLGVERGVDPAPPNLPLDRARLEVSGDGGQNWSPVYQNPDASDVSDRQWRAMSYDLTAAAALRPDVRLRFTLASSADVELMGWQVDDLIVRDPLLPPWQACGPALQYVSHRIDDAAGNGNGLADPGETVRLPVRLGNDGVAAASGVSATLRSGRPDLADFVSPTASYADLPPGGSAESDPPHPGLALSPAARCGTRIPVTLAARSAGGAATAGFDVVVGPGATTTSSFSPPPPLPLPIPDLDPTGVALSIPVTAAEPALAIEVTVGINHPSAGQLVVTLTAPGGRTVTLHDFTGAGVAFGSRTYPAPVAPDGPGSLADELGEVPAGTWTLRAIDAVGGTTGTLGAVTLRILHPDPAGGVSGPIASPLRLVREGSDVVATFGLAPGAAAHELAKAPLATLEGLGSVATSTTASARETGGAAAGGSYYYVVRGLDACGRPGP